MSERRYNDLLAAHALLHAVATGKKVHIVCANEEEAQRVYDEAVERVRSMMPPDLEERGR